MDLKEAQKRYNREVRERDRHLPALFLNWCHPEWGSVRIPDRKVETLRRAAAVLYGKKVEDIEVYEDGPVFTWTPHMDAHNYSIFDLPCEEHEVKYAPVRDIN